MRMVMGWLPVEKQATAATAAEHGEGDHHGPQGGCHQQEAGGAEDEKPAEQ
jgi:hypothetical protein